MFEGACRKMKVIASATILAVSLLSARLNSKFCMFEGSLSKIVEAIAELTCLLSANLISSSFLTFSGACQN